MNTLTSAEPAPTAGNVIDRIDTGAPPTPDEIDRLITDFDSAQRMVAAAKEVESEVKQRLIHLVQEHGQMPATATASKRLAGRHNEAVVTTGTTTTVNENAVADFEEFLDSKRLLDYFPRFFAVQTKHTLVDGARDVLATITLPKTIEDKLFQLFGRTVDVRTKAASLKVNVILPEKPTRKPRAGKAAA